MLDIGRTQRDNRQKLSKAIRSCRLDKMFWVE